MFRYVQLGVGRWITCVDSYADRDSWRANIRVENRSRTTACRKDSAGMLCVLPLALPPRFWGQARARAISRFLSLSFSSHTLHMLHVSLFPSHFYASILLFFLHIHTSMHTESILSYATHTHVHSDAPILLFSLSFSLSLSLSLFLSLIHSAP